MSRDEVIKLLKLIKSTVYLGNRKFLDALEFAISYLRQPERKKGKWIPCSERLPDDVQIGEEYPVVIFCTKEKTYTGFYEYYLGCRRWIADGDDIVAGVIAWMPLPAQYTEVEND